MKVGKVDCTSFSNLGLCLTYAINGYPTLLLFKDGKYYEFNGERSVESFERFIH